MENQIESSPGLEVPTGALQQRLQLASRYCIVVCCFFIPLSSSLMGATAVLAMLLWLLGGNYSSSYRLIKTNIPALLSLLLFVLLGLSIIYSSSPAAESLASLKKYRELLYLPLTYVLFYERSIMTSRATAAFLAGCMVLLGISYAMFFSVIPVEKFGFSTVYHITHSFFMAVLAFWSLQKAICSAKWRLLWIVVMLLASVNLFYIAPGRTGMLIFITLSAISFLQHFSLQKSLIALGLAALFLTFFFFTSNNFASRIQLAVQEIESYHPDAQRSRSSLGMRFDWWHNSFELIKQKPFLGHGVGAFSTAQAELIRGTKIQPTDNPHNEYLYLGVQIGLPGLLLFLCLLGSLFIKALHKQTSRNFLLQGVIVAMATGCLMNSFLFDSHQGHFFAILSGILGASKTQPRNSIDLQADAS